MNLIWIKNWKKVIMLKTRMKNKASKTKRGVNMQWCAEAWSSEGGVKPLVYRQWKLCHVTLVK